MNLQPLRQSPYSQARWPRQSAGFTLLEVMVALVIVGTALMASIRAVASLSHNSGAMRELTLATWSAENRFINIRVAEQWPSLGQNEFDCSQSAVRMICQENVSAAANPNFRRVEISVLDAGDRARLIIKLVQLVPNAL